MEHRLANRHSLQAFGGRLEAATKFPDLSNDPVPGYPSKRAGLQ